MGLCVITLDEHRVRKLACACLMCIVNFFQVIQPTVAPVALPLVDWTRFGKQAAAAAEILADLLPACTQPVNPDCHGAVQDSVTGGCAERSSASLLDAPPRSTLAAQADSADGAAVPAPTRQDGPLDNTFGYLDATEAEHERDTQPPAVAAPATADTTVGKQAARHQAWQTEQRRWYQCQWEEERRATLLRFELPWRRLLEVG